MILADTSVWIDHFRATNATLQGLLQSRKIIMHPFVVAELALGSLGHRATTLKWLDALPAMRSAHLHEVRHMIDSHSLHGKGIGLVDAQLLASTMINPGTQLWTLDKRLKQIAESLAIHATP
jgi:predicted nucleic acid-binding protein